ncbi:galactokinase [Varibaculum massiliense]|uniref:galactokinase n=1 Tax=Varibaculum massiliense TaxID=1852372 RepID=UPI0008D96A94|nr:galactokinase [Varibaculum massiliense]
MSIKPEFIPAYQPKEGAQRAKELFEKTFSALPSGVWRAPGRVNVIGEHTDYNGGKALPLALPHAIYVALRVSEDGQLKIISEDFPELSIIKLSDLEKHYPATGPGAFVGGVILGLAQVLGDNGQEELARRLQAKVPGLEVAVASSVPLSAGLSSSAALECAIAVGIDELAGLGLTKSFEGRKLLVEAGKLAENRYVGAPTGGLDQSASMLCEKDCVLELDCSTWQTRSHPFDLPALGLSLLVIDTCTSHDLADGQYGARRAACEEAARVLGVEELGELVPKIISPADNLTDLDADDYPPTWVQQQLDKLEDTEQVLRVRHVLTEIARCQRLCELLEAGADLDEWRKLLDASHDSLRRDYQVSCKELDAAVAAARKAGAFGARMTGGGFGGCAITLVNSDQVEATARAVVEAFNKAGFNRPRFLSVSPSPAAGKVE